MKIPSFRKAANSLYKKLKKQVSELNEQKLAVEDSVAYEEHVLIDKEDHICSLAECLLKITLGCCF
jgi:hypothetical protein